ncbi:MAG: hypothetical protein IJJ40_03460 [Clostridia bacterium]|nr:hypothetical protein [Clostridia bacterium]
MKKIISVLVAILIVAMTVTVATTSVFAGEVEKTTFTVESKTVSPGETFDATIKVTNNSGITSAKFNVAFDSGLTLNSVTYGVTGGIMPQSLKSPVILNWCDALDDKIGDFTFATLNFTLSADATENQNISLTYDPDDFFNVADDTIDIKVVNGIISIPHEHNYSNETVDAKYLKSAATCTEPAVYYKSCSCGEASTTETFTSGKALGHDYKDTIVPPTCTEKGYTNHVCSRCNDTYTDTYTDALGHALIEEVDGKYLAEGAGCTEAATYYKHCSRCDFISNETFKSGTPAGHNPGTAVVENKTDSTCTAEGSYDEVVYCTVCNTELKRETKTILKKDHTPATKQDNLIPATCTADGSYDEVIYCTVCKNELSREPKIILKKDHTPGAAQQENLVAATCTEAGSYDEVVYCTECKNELSREPKTIKALGHEFSTEWTTNPEEHYHKCIRCKERADFGYHEAGEWEVVKEPTTKEEGERAKLCTVCGYELVSEPIDKLIEYKVTEGADSTFKAGGKAIKFGTNIPKDGLAALVVKVDGVEVDPENYTVSGEDEVEVELKPEYLATLKAGKHTVTIGDGVGLATAEITVEAEKPASDKTSPKTADVSFYLAMLLLISTAVLTSTLIYRKKVK